jgi:hypothetical protein
MKKKLLILFFLSFFSVFSFSQSKFNLGASFNLGMPFGSFNDITNTGIGGSIIGEYAVNSRVSIILSIYYQNFPGDFNKFAVGGKAYDVSVNSVPLLAGIRYYFNESFFGILKTGPHFVRVSADVSDIYSKEKLSTDFEAKFGAGAGAGFRYKLAEQSVFEFSGVLNYVTDDFNSIALSASVLILLDKL